MNRIIGLLSLCIACICCTNTPEGTPKNDFPDIFPDYKFVTVPCNIAPLNFEVGKSRKVVADFRVDGTSVVEITGRRKVCIPFRKWRKLVDRAIGKSIEVKVKARLEDGKWYSFQPFTIGISADSIDSHIAYRLIEPGYELWGQMGIYQRELSTFKEKAIIDNALLVEGGCVNCHSFRDYSPRHFLFHARQAKGGTVFVDDKQVRKVNLKTDSTISAGVYPKWHPQGEWVAFSNNDTYQSFYGFHERKVEVYDLESDLILFHPATDRVIRDTRLSGKEYLETFPAWSADGKWLYFCRAAYPEEPRNFVTLRYGIYRIAFDAATGELQGEVETVVDERKMGKTVLFPRISPDGRYLLYTSADYGTFPIWAAEADLGMLDLHTGRTIDVGRWNSGAAESYHSWSSNGCWVIFSSRRTDGLYTRLYIAHWDKEGGAGKPVLLPQEDPRFYQRFLKSYNIPEFIKGEVKISPYRLAEVIDGTEAAPVYDKK